MKYEIKEIIDASEKENITKTVLYDLPDWFGLPESTQEYIDEAQNMPFLACYTEGKLVGFVALNATSKDCADIFVMGLMKEYHRKGAGRKLNEEYEKLARRLGYTYSQVKTVKMGHYPNYDITNNFYIAMGYKELECFPNLWDEWNPCQIYVKYLGSEA